MLNDLMPVVHKFPDGKDITIVPVFDLHVGSREFDGAAWQRFASEIQNEPNTYVVLGGDMMDNGICNPALPFEQDMRPADQKKYLVKTLEPIRDKILCACSGNHEYRSMKMADECPLYDVMAKLDIEERFRENACFLFLRFKEHGKTAGGHRPFYSVMVTHGSGGGGYIGASANKNERYGMSIDGLDVLITGHTHKPMNFPSRKLIIDPQNNQIIQRDFRVVVASSWLDYGGYALRKMLPPNARCEQRILFKGNKKEVRVLM